MARHCALGRPIDKNGNMVWMEKRGEKLKDNGEQ